jgi:hypothetical protein
MSGLAARDLESVSTARLALFAFREQSRDVHAERERHGSCGVESRLLSALEATNCVSAESGAFC